MKSTVPKFKLGQKVFNIYDYRIYETESIKFITGTPDGWKYSAGDYVQNQITDETGFPTREDAEKALAKSISDEVDRHREELLSKSKEN